jgi:hypothetical protein
MTLVEALNYRLMISHSRSVLGNQALKMETEIGAKSSGNHAGLPGQFSTVFIQYKTM